MSDDEHVRREHPVEDDRDRPVPEEHCAGNHRREVEVTEHEDRRPESALRLVESRGGA